MSDERTARVISFEQFAPMLLAGIILLQGIFSWRFMGACAGAADSSGYLNSARLLARGEFSTAVRPVEGINAEVLPGYIDEIYAPLGFRPILRNRSISPTYPVGLPLLIAGMAKVTNWEVAPGLTLVIHAMIGALLMYALGREFGLSAGWSLIGTLMLVASPLFYHMTLWTMSDVPALAWTTGGLLCAWLARRRPAWALAAGFALGFSVLLRPTGALAFLPAIIALGFARGRVPLFILSGLPAAVVLARYNLGAYGSIFTSGYFNPPDVFALHHAGPALVQYAIWLPVLLTPLMLAAPALPWARNVDVRKKWVLGTWVSIFSGFYAIYSFTHESWWYLRFLLPAFPPLIAATLLVMRGYSGRKQGRVSSATAWLVVSTMIVIHGLLWTRALYARGIGKSETAYKTTAAWVQSHLPSKSVVFAMQDSGALFYYTDFSLVRWDWLRPEQFRSASRALHAAGRPIYAVLQDFEQDDALMRHIPGEWIKVDRVQNRTVLKLDSAP